jgi:hypothetical protein
LNVISARSPTAPHSASSFNFSAPLSSQFHVIKYVTE